MVDTSPILDQELITERRADESGDIDRLAIYRDYASGRHVDPTSVEQRKLLQRQNDHDVADNVCQLILNTTASRLHLERWSVDPVSSEGPRDQVQAFLDRLALVNRLGRLQHETHFAQLRDGNAVISLGWNNQRKSVRLARETWWDGTDGVFIAYTADGDPEWAVKEFTDRDPLKPTTMITRRTIYFPDRICRYVEQGGWREYVTPTQPAVSSWLKKDDAPLGIPFVHFPNGSSVSDSWYGQSDLVGLIGLQDDLNMLQHDLSAAALHAGFQMLWGTGIPPSTRLKVAPGGMMRTDAPEARFGTFPPGDMSRLAEVHAYKRQTMSINSGTPLHVITGGDWPSGEAILRAETPLVDKVERLASVAGPQWTLVAHRATEMTNTFSNAHLDEAIPITSVFAAPERIDESTNLTLNQQRVDLWDTLSRLPKTAMLKTGLVTEDEATAIIAERDADMLDAGTYQSVPDEQEGT